MKVCQENKKALEQLEIIDTEKSVLPFLLIVTNI